MVSKFRKWTPNKGTPSHWLDDAGLAQLLGAQIKKNPDLPVRAFLREFTGLSGSANQKRVLDASGLSGAKLSQLREGDKVSKSLASRLLNEMNRVSRAPKPGELGVLGKQSMHNSVKSIGVSPDECKYKKVFGVHEGKPYVIECLFATDWGMYTDDDSHMRRLITGVNFSPSIGGGSIFGTLGSGRDIEEVLGDRYCGRDEPVIFVIHLTTPIVGWENRGKSEVILPPPIANDLEEAILTVTKQWHKEQDKVYRQAVREFRRRPKTSSGVSIKDAAFQVMEQAYIDASGQTGIANARQVMYAARPHIQQLTGKPLNDNYFTQTLLPDFIAEHPQLTKDWNVLFDSRGDHHEPHTGLSVPLGTGEVEHYIRRIETHNLAGSGESLRVSIDNSMQTVGPEARFGGILFAEKEGFLPLLRKAKIAERYDLALMSTKGVTVTAARQLVDYLSQFDVPVYVLHDFDVAGFTILGTFLKSSRRYTYEHDLQVVDFGLRLNDVNEMALLSEDQMHKKKPTRENLRQNGATEEEIDFLLSGKRVELNAMTSDQMIDWIESKLRDERVSKVIPAEDILAEAYRAESASLRLQEFIEPHVSRIESESRQQPIPSGLRGLVEERLRECPELPWDEAVKISVTEQSSTG